MAARAKAVQRPTDMLPDCTVIYQGTDLCFQTDRGRRCPLNPTSQLVYEGSAITPEELDEGTKANLRLGANNSVISATITYWKRRPTRLQQFNEAVVVFSMRKFPTSLLSSLYEGEDGLKPRLSFLQERYMAMRKIGDEGLRAFLTAVGLAYLEHLMLPQVEIEQLNNFYYEVKATQEDSLSPYLEALWQAKQTGAGCDALDQYSSNPTFRVALTKTLTALILHFMQQHPDNDLAVTAAVVADGFEGYKTLLEYENDLIQHETTIALVAYVLPIRLKVYSTYEADRIVTPFPCDDQRRNIVRIALLSRTNTYCVLYSKAVCHCEGFVASLDARQKPIVGPGYVRALYYVPKKKEEIQGHAQEEEQETLSTTVSLQLALTETVQKLIGGVLSILDNKEVRLGEPFFTEELIMQTYETKSAYKKQLLQVKSAALDAETEAKLTYLERFPSFANLALMKQCSKCDKHPGVVLLAICKHYLCDGCMRGYIQEFLELNHRILEPDGETMKSFVCPIRTCQTAEPLPTSILRFFLGAQFDYYIDQAEHIVMTKKCKKCGTLQEQGLFYLTQTCGCKICAYCLIELVGSHQGYCLCGQYIQPDVMQRASQHKMRCPMCNDTKSLIQEYTPVKCSDHIICRQCLEAVMDSPDKRCPLDYRVFAGYEIDTARQYFTRQCMLYCGRSFNSSKELLKVSCSCVYCEDCAKRAAKHFREYRNCYNCRMPFPPETIAKFDYYRKVEQHMQTVKADLHVAEECKLCKGPIGRVQRLVLTECAHSFHIQCLKDYAENYVSTDFKKIMPCPEANCGKEINGSAIEHDLLKAKDFNKYCDRLTRIVVNVTQCPQCKAEFEFVKRDDLAVEAVRCQFCGFSFCSECKMEFQANHDAKTCKHNMTLSIIAALQASAEGNPAFSVAQCPACQTPYLKDDNCDHVQCVKPGCVSFCFKCSCLRAPTMEHHNMWHRPQCPHYEKVANDDEPQRPKCPECIRLGKRCDPPADLKTPCLFDIDEY